MLTLASCYLMWMVTYMAQLHPLVGMCIEFGYIEAQLRLAFSPISDTEDGVLNVAITSGVDQVSCDCMYCQVIAEHAGPTRFTMAYTISTLPVLVVLLSLLCLIARNRQLSGHCLQCNLLTNINQEDRLLTYFSH